MSEKKLITVNATGLKCDNVSCDYVDNDIKYEDYESCIDKPCPKCGSNLLTREDFETAQGLHDFANLLNSLPQKLLDELAKVSPEKEEAIKAKYGLPEDTKEVKVVLDTHNGVTIKEVIPVKKEE